MIIIQVVNFLVGLCGVMTLSAGISVIHDNIKVRKVTAAIGLEGHVSVSLPIGGAIMVITGLVTFLHSWGAL